MMYLSTGVGCLQNAVVSSIILPNLELQGTIPDSIGMLSYLQTIEMSSNQLYGSLPSTVGLLSELLILDLSSNSLDSIPNELANLVNLTTLILDGNSLEGTIPVFLAEMTQLEILSLRANKFTGNFPDVFCEMNHTEVFVHGNQFLCYSECLLHGAEDGCVYPPKPALLSAGAIAGIAVAFFFVASALVAYLSYQRYKFEKEYLALPLHRRLIKGKPITLDDVRKTENLGCISDKRGRTVLEVAFEMDRLDLVSEDAMYFLLENSMHLGMEDGAVVKKSSGREGFEAGYVWPALVQQTEDFSFTVMCKLLNKYEQHGPALVATLDRAGRRCLDIASTRMKAELQKCMYLYRRFEVTPGPAEHRSATSIVVFALDHGTNGINMTSPTKVALKFMKHKHPFDTDISFRREQQFDQNFVVSVLDYFDGSDFSESNAGFTSAAAKRGFGDYPFCLVMPLAETNLDTVIARRHIVGEDWDEIKLILKTLCNCLVHIHSKNILHGDLKPNNLVMIDNAICLIDFDASSSFGPESTDFAGAKYSSGYLPPEMFHDEGRKVKEFTVDTLGDRVGVEYFDAEVVVSTKSTRARTVTRHVALHADGYELLKPSPAHDMWAVGIIFYLLCTGFEVFPTSVEGNVDRSTAANICAWTNDLKEQKLALVQDRLAKNLLSLLLSKDPSLRPSADHVLSHPFLSGQRAARMQGEAPEYDVFLSYRVFSDSQQVELLYKQLTALGLNVWWDKNCLLPGQKWEEGFCNGLINSSCFVCLISKDGIFNPDRNNCNFTKLTAKSVCDNVLLEWRFALDLRERNMISGIFPVFIGEKKSSTSGKGSDYSGFSGDFSLMPKESVETVEKKLEEHLESQGLGTPLLGKLTVQEIVSEITANQGGFVKGNLEVAVATVCRSIAQRSKYVKTPAETPLPSARLVDTYVRPTGTASFEWGGSL
jgi:serine/threonine protein kinase